MSYELNAKCPQCERYMLVKASSSASIEVRCNDRRCKTWNTVQVVMMTDHIKGEKHRPLSKLTDKI